MRIKKLLLIGVCFLVFITVWIALASTLANNLIIEKPIAQADAILVLGGSAAYLERTQEAAKIFKQGIAPKIFLTNDGMQSGWSEEESRNPFFVELARSQLIQSGVPPEAIEMLPGTVNGTHDEANLLVAILKERKLKSILLVTSAYHTRRTLWTFARAMCKNDLMIEIGVESPPTGLQTPSPSTWWFSLQGWQIVGEEYLKMIYYWLIY